VVTIEALEYSVLSSTNVLNDPSSAVPSGGKGIFKRLREWFSYPKPSIDPCLDSLM
jgi:hypothetical protein